MKKIAIKTIELYKKFISPCIIKSCRYYPSCSDYAKEALEVDGFLKGSVKSLWRILRCNPFSRGGYDPVKK